MSANAEQVTAAMPGNTERHRDIPYIYRQRRGESYPAREEFFTAAPASVDTKARYGYTQVQLEMVGHRRRKSARQGIEGPGQGYDY